MKTTTTYLTLTLVLLALVTGGAALAPAPESAQAKPIVWSLPTVAAPSYFHTVDYNAFGAKLTEKSQGRLTR
jgi:TRAP-type C4-dicarboxylate transport system substrate-binding protein